MRFFHRASFIEGTLSASGSSGSGGNSGGSGGSIWLDGQIIEGWGHLHVTGGSGSHRVTHRLVRWCSSHGGGGAGGRTRMYSELYTNKVGKQFPYSAECF